MSADERITSPKDPAFDELCQHLLRNAASLDQPHTWPDEVLRHCAAAGVFEWFVPAGSGGQGWPQPDLMEAYMRLGSACLTTTFVLTQFVGACQRVATCHNEPLKQQLMPALVQGTAQATLGISHLTTSRRHLARPVLRAGETTAGFQLDGFTPWVTGARHAQHVLTGATLADGRHILLLVPLDAPGVSVAEPVRLVALNASQTGPVHFDHAEVPRACLVAGPAEDVMQAATGASTGGLPTSALALGLARSALEYVEEEAERRKELIHPVEQLAAEWRAIRDQLLRLAAGEGPGTLVDLRARANSLVLRAAQMALVAAKGAGFVEGHPAGRWCREALFFLVWSCPQPVLDANLCELAGIAD